MITRDGIFNDLILFKEDRIGINAVMDAIDLYANKCVIDNKEYESTVLIGDINEAIKIMNKIKETLT